MPAPCQLDASDGDLRIRTDVTGPAARMGHHLTILVATWHASVGWDGDEPVAVELTADVDSLQIERGDGGVTPLSGPERALARTNALKTLSAQRYPTVTFTSDRMTPAGGGYHLAGELEIHGHHRAHSLDVAVTDKGDGWRLEARSAVRQTDFGVRPYSMFMGSMKVVDTVTIEFSATVRR
ncbi:polyisoprenoid-binding protein [Mycolicibacterium litorale]|uniref:Polyisoprenoid-binding protein n=1 Tax=Mycolicibacterium litorale TaxID=758802 RepID=A0A6S6P5H1_9MYCO|nr:YceI family protein [Mycolicibacterium litorale]BCI51558.1 polyisoprenoid-binding protein [Mycolicibacterium litorale]